MNLEKFHRLNILYRQYFKKVWFCFALLFVVGLSLAYPIHQVLADKPEESLEQLEAQLRKNLNDLYDAKEILRNPEKYTKQQVFEAGLAERQHYSVVESTKNKIRYGYGDPEKIVDKIVSEVKTQLEGEVEATLEKKTEKFDTAKKVHAFKLNRDAWSKNMSIMVLLGPGKLRRMAEFLNPSHFLNSSKSIAHLAQQYYDLQDDLRPRLLLKQEQWTYEEAMVYQAERRALCMGLITVEKNLLWHLGFRYEGMGPAEEREKQRMIALLEEIKKKYRAGVRLENTADGHAAKMSKLKRQWCKIAITAGLVDKDCERGDDPIIVPSDSAVGRALQFIAAKFYKEKEKRDKLEKSADALKMSGKIILNKIENIIMKRGLNWMEIVDPEFRIHTESEGQNQYREYLSENDYKSLHDKGHLRMADNEDTLGKFLPNRGELRTYRKQNIKRRAAFPDK